MRVAPAIPSQSQPVAFSGLSKGQKAGMIPTALLALGVTAGCENSVVSEVTRGTSPIVFTAPDRPNKTVALALPNDPTILAAGRYDTASSLIGHKTRIGFVKPDVLLPGAFRAYETDYDKDGPDGEKVTLNVPTQDEFGMGLPNGRLVLPENRSCGNLFKKIGRGLGNDNSRYTQYHIAQVEALNPGGQVVVGDNKPDFRVYKVTDDGAVDKKAPLLDVQINSAAVANIPALLGFVAGLANVVLEMDIDEVEERFPKNSGLAELAGDQFDGYADRDPENCSRWFWGLFKNPEFLWKKWTSNYGHSTDTPYERFKDPDIQDQRGQGNLF